MAERGLLFAVDYPIYHDISHVPDIMDEDPNDKRILMRSTSPIGLFAIGKDAKGVNELKIVAIQMNYKPGRKFLLLQDRLTDWLMNLVIGSLFGRSIDCRMNWVNLRVFYWLTGRLNILLVNRSILLTVLLINWLIYYAYARFTVWTIKCFINQLEILLIDQHFVCFVDLPTEWMTDWVLDRFIAWLIDWCIGGWLMDWLIDCLFDSIIGWLIDYSIDCLIELLNIYWFTEWRNA